MEDWKVGKEKNPIHLITYYLIHLKNRKATCKQSRVEVKKQMRVGRKHYNRGITYQIASAGGNLSRQLNNLVKYTKSSKAQHSMFRAEGEKNGNIN